MDPRPEPTAEHGTADQRPGVRHSSVQRPGVRHSSVRHSGVRSTGALRSYVEALPRFDRILGTLVVHLAGWAGLIATATAGTATNLAGGIWTVICVVSLSITAGAAAVLLGRTLPTWTGTAFTWLSVAVFTIIALAWSFYLDDHSPIAEAALPALGPLALLSVPFYPFAQAAVLLGTIQHDATSAGPSSTGRSSATAEATAHRGTAAAGRAAVRQGAASAGFNPASAGAGDPRSRERTSAPESNLRGLGTAIVAMALVAFAASAFIVWSRFGITVTLSPMRLLPIGIASIGIVSLLVLVHRVSGGELTAGWSIAFRVAAYLGLASGLSLFAFSTMLLIDESAMDVLGSALWNFAFIGFPVCIVAAVVFSAIGGVRRNDDAVAG